MSNIKYYDQLTNQQRKYVASSLRERIIGYEFCLWYSGLTQQRVTSFSGKDSYDSILSAVTGFITAGEYKIKSASTYWNCIKNNGVMIKESKHHNLLKAANKDGYDNPAYLSFFMINKRVTIHYLKNLSYTIDHNFYRQADDDFDSDHQEESTVYLYPMSAATVVHWSAAQSMEYYTNKTLKNLVKRFNDERWLNVNIFKRNFRK